MLYQLCAARAATIAELASSTPDLSDLVAAVKAANLTSALSNPNANLTVFAPTNEAFSNALAMLKLPINELLANTELLTKVLEYHVVPGVYMASDLKDGETLMTLLPGGTLTVMMMGKNVTIVPTGGPPATVVKADIMASNGVIHIINGVLLPGAAPAME